MKRIITLVVALVMVLSIVPFAVSAADTPEVKWGTSIDDLGGEGREGTWTEAVSTAEDREIPAYIQFQKDVTFAGSIYIGNLTQDLTIDLNGCDITINKAQGVVFKTTTGHTVTFTDNHTDPAEWGGITGTVGGHGIIFINATAGINVNVVVNAGNYEDVSAMVKVNASDYTGTITLAGGNFVGESTTSAAALAYIKSGTIVLDENFTYTVAAPRDLQLYFSGSAGSVDLSEHANPNGVRIQSYKNTPDSSVITLPAGFNLFDAAGEKVTGGNLSCSNLTTSVYTVKGAPVAPPPSEDEGTEDAVAVLEGIVPSETVAAKVAPEAKPGAKAPALRAPKAPAKGIAARTARPKF